MEQFGLFEMMGLEPAEVYGEVAPKKRDAKKDAKKTSSSKSKGKRTYDKDVKLCFGVVSWEATFDERPTLKEIEKRVNKELPISKAFGIDVDLRTYIKPAVIAASKDALARYVYVGASKITFSESLLNGREGVDADEALKEVIGGYPQYAGCTIGKFNEGEENAFVALPFIQEEVKNEEFSLPMTVGWGDVTVEVKEGKADMKNLLEQYKKAFPKVCVNSLSWNEDTNSFVVSMAQTSSNFTKKEDEKYPLPVMVRTALTSIEFTKEDFPEKDEVTLEEVRAELAKLYPEFSKDRTVMNFDKEGNFIVPILKSSSKGAIINGIRTKGEQLPSVDEVSQMEGYQIFFGADGERIEKKFSGVFASKGDKLEFRQLMPKIPGYIYNKIVDSFRLGSDAEMAFQIFWDKEARAYTLVKPEQRATRASVHFVPAHTKSERYEHVMDVHSHGHIPAFFSGQDNRDEVSTGLFMVIGDICDTDGSYKELLRAGMGGVFTYCAVDEVFAV